MTNKLKNYIIPITATFMDALKLIEFNQMRFVVVVDDEDTVVGVLTDGDIRRSLLSGKRLNDIVVPYRGFLYLDVNDDFATVCNKFRDYQADFLLILKSGKLFNIVTKAQFHLMLLEDMEYSANINYSDFDHRKLEHEVYNKPWGFYKSVLLSSHAQAKVITLFPDSEISLQEHMHREEHWVVIKGVGKVVCSNDLFDIKAGGYIKIPKRMKHKIINTSVKDNLVFSEVQLGEYFGEDDIIRHSDKYGRT